MLTSFTKGKGVEADRSRPDILGGNLKFQYCFRKKSTSKNDSGNLIKLDGESIQLKKTTITNKKQLKVPQTLITIEKANPGYFLVSFSNTKKFHFKK